MHYGMLKSITYKISGAMNDVEFGHFDDEIFAGLWDDLPGMGLDPGQIGAQPARQPPPAPRLRPVEQQFEYWPYLAPQAAVNQAVPAGAQAGNPQNQLPAFQPPPGYLNIQPQVLGGNVGAAQEGDQAFPAFQALPRRSPRAAVYPGNELPQPQLVAEQAFAEQRERIRELRLRNNLDNLQQQRSNAAPLPELGIISPEQMAQELQRQRQQMQLDMPWGMQPDGGFDVQQNAAMLHPARQPRQLSPEVLAAVRQRSGMARADPPGVLAHNIPRRRMPPLNPPNGQA